MWEYVLHSRQEYDHVVALQTYVPHNWCRTVLQPLVVVLIHNPEYEGNGCFGTIFGYSKRVS
jgi:hypothetical protein